MAKKNSSLNSGKLPQNSYYYQSINDRTEPAIPLMVYKDKMQIYLDWLENYTANGGLINGNTPWSWFRQNWFIVVKNPFIVGEMQKGDYKLILAPKGIEVVAYNETNKTKDTIFYWKGDKACKIGHGVVSLYSEHEFDKYENCAIWRKHPENYGVYNALKRVYSKNG